MITTVVITEIKITEVIIMITNHEDENNDNYLWIHGQDLLEILFFLSFIYEKNAS